jgi:colanic acid biosynthesis glycosyl transferase WcaI
MTAEKYLTQRRPPDAAPPLQGDRKLRFLVLGLNFAPEIISTGLYTTGLAETMARSGDRVEVVCGQPYYPAWKVFEGYPRLGYRRRALDSGVGVVHCPHYVPARPSGLRRILHHASFCLSAAPVMFWKAWRLRPDIIFVATPALLPAPLAWAAARLVGAKCWLHVQDFEVEAAFATGLLPQRGPLGGFARAFDNWVHRIFDRVSSISEPMTRKLAQRGIPDEHISELRNWANLSVVRPMREGSSPLRGELGITRRHVALYSGNIARKQGLDILPEVAQKLRNRKDLCFVVCGDGPFLADLKRQAKGLDNMSFLPLQPVDRLGDLLGMASVHLLPQIAGVADLLLPSKLTNMLASGRPVVATAAEGTALARAVIGCGLISPPGDAGAMASAIERLLDDEDLRGLAGRTARERAVEHWDASRILSRFREDCHRLVGADRRPARKARPGMDGAGR